MVKRLKYIYTFCMAAVVSFIEKCLMVLEEWYNKICSTCRIALISLVHYGPCL